MDIAKDEVMVIIASVEAEVMAILEVNEALDLGVAVVLTKAMVEIEVNEIDTAKDKVMEMIDEVAITSLSICIVS
jgi:hypothetical protein